MKYLIMSYQVLNGDGSRDTVRLLQPKVVEDIEEYREHVKKAYNCKSVNLNYMEEVQ